MDPNIESPLTRIAKSIAVVAALAVPAICHAVDTTSAAYRNGKTAGYVFGGILLLILAKRLLPSSFAWARWLVVPVVACAIWLLHAPARPQKLDRPAIEAFTQTSAQAIARRHADVLCAQYDEQAEIKLVEVRFSGSEVKTYAKPQMCDLIRRGYAAIPAGVETTASVNLQSVDIAADGQSGDLSVDVVEEVSIGGQSTRTTSQQTATVALIAGQLRFTRVNARMTVSK